MSARSLQLVLFDPLIPSYCPQPRAETPRKRFYVMGIGRVLGASQLLNDMTLQKAWDPIKSTHWYHESWDVPVEEVWDNESWVFLISSFSAPFYLMNMKYIYIYIYSIEISDDIFNHLLVLGCEFCPSLKQWSTIHEWHSQYQKHLTEALNSESHRSFGVQLFLSIS